MGAFVLSHIDAPVDALAEVARTTRRGGAVMTLGFDRRWEFGAKELVDGALVHTGATIPPWYDEFKNAVEPLTAYPDRLDAVARRRPQRCAGDRDGRRPRRARRPGLVAWRTGNPIFAPFLAGLDAFERDSLLDSIYVALGPDPPPLVPELLVLSGRVA